MNDLWILRVGLWAATETRIAFFTIKVKKQSDKFMFYNNIFSRSDVLRD